VALSPESAQLIVLGFQSTAVEENSRNSCRLSARLAAFNIDRGAIDSFGNLAKCGGVQRTAAQAEMQGGLEILHASFAVPARAARQTTDPADSIRLRMRSSDSRCPARKAIPSGVMPFVSCRRSLLCNSGMADLFQQVRVGYTTPGWGV